jgi:hypothetical protein
LHDLTKKDQSWNWGKVQQDAFETLKNRFTTLYHVECDASDFATGAVLSTLKSDK